MNFQKSTMYGVFIDKSIDLSKTVWISHCVPYNLYPKNVMHL